MRMLAGSAACVAGFIFSAQAMQAQITVAQPMPATVTVHVGSAGTVQIPRSVFGSFLEPIGNSINGGVDAEILTNGSLESGLWNHTNLEHIFADDPELIESTNATGIPLPWKPLDFDAGNRFVLRVGDAANSWQSLVILGKPGAQAGIRQRVYLPVQRELTYRVSLYVKHVSGPTGVKVLLRDSETGATLAESTVDAPAGEWAKYETKLELKRGAVRLWQPVDFGIAVDGTERAFVDEISLMPDDAIGIFDPDEVAMLKAMHLTELRLGGNFTPTTTGKTASAPPTSASR